MFTCWMYRVCSCAKSQYVSTYFSAEYNAKEEPELLQLVLNWPVPKGTQQAIRLEYLGPRGITYHFKMKMWVEKY